MDGHPVCVANVYWKPEMVDGMVMAEKSGDCGDSGGVVFPYPCAKKQGLCYYGGVLSIESIISRQGWQEKGESLVDYGG